MKGKSLHAKVTWDSWCDIASDHRCFDGKCSRSTKRIDKGFFVSPSRKCDQCRCKTFFEGSLSRFLPISSLVKRITSDIQEHMRSIFYYEDQDMNLNATRCIWGTQSRENRFLTHGLDSWNARKDWFRRGCLDDNALFSCEVHAPINIFQGFE